MKTFTWIENEDDEVANGYYECKLHDREDCPYCTDVSVEKPLRWGIAGKRSLLDEAMDKIIGGKK